MLFSNCSGGRCYCNQNTRDHAECALSVISQIELVAEKCPARHRLPVAPRAGPLAPQFACRHLTAPGHCFSERLAQIEIATSAFHTRTTKPQRRLRVCQIQLALHFAMPGAPSRVEKLKRDLYQLQPRKLLCDQRRSVDPVPLL